MKNNSFKTKVLKILDDPSSKYFLFVNNFLAFLTIISIVSLILETIESLSGYRNIFNNIEYVVAGFFALEYLFRIYSSKNKLRYALSFLGIVDLLSIIPTAAQIGNFTFLKSARVLRLLRLFRILRLFKVARSVRMTKDIEESLNIKIYFIALVSVVIISGSLLHVVEGNTEQFSDMVKTITWTAKTTLGGIPGVYPETGLGELVGIITRFFGLLLFGLLINIIGRGFQRVLLGGGKVEK